MAKKAEEKAAEKAPEPKKLHERIMEQIDACEDLTKEETNQALKELQERIESKTLNVVNDTTEFDLRALFDFKTSPLGQDFWTRINFTITKITK